MYHLLMILKVCCVLW